MQSIHRVSPYSIIKALTQDPWYTGSQEITSANTNTNTTTYDALESDGAPAIADNTEGFYAFCDLDFDSDVVRVLDVGGGKFEHNTKYMKTVKRKELLVWDPFNRDPGHNAMIQHTVDLHKVDAAVSMSVLNVISDWYSRLTHINTLKISLKLGGKAYFKIWPGDGLLRGSCIPIITESSYQANAFAFWFLREVQIVFGYENVILHDTIPNLLIATKRIKETISLADIKYIQDLAKQEAYLKRAYFLFKISRGYILPKQIFFDSEPSRSIPTSLFFLRRNGRLIKVNADAADTGRVRHKKLLK